MLITIAEIAGMTYGIELCIVRAPQKYRTIVVSLIFLSGGLGNLLGSCVSNLYTEIGIGCFGTFAAISAPGIIVFNASKTYNQKDILAA